jgi:pullulanase/glycogen debranching enzyme
LPDRGAFTLRWLSPGGQDMQVDDWHHGGSLAFACKIVSHEDGGRAPLLICFNPEPLDIPFTLPAGLWQLALDSSGELPREPAAQARRALTVPQRCLLVLRRTEST